MGRRAAPDSRLPATDPIAERGPGALEPYGSLERAGEPARGGRAPDPTPGSGPPGVPSERHSAAGLGVDAAGPGSDRDDQLVAGRRCAAVAVSGSLATSAASAPRAWTPSASTSSDNGRELGLRPVEAGVTTASPQIVSSVTSDPAADRSMPATMPAAPSEMTSAATQPGERRQIDRTRDGYASGPIRWSRALAQVAELARHVPRREAEPLPDDVERADVVETELAELVRGHRERDAQSLRRAGDERMSGTGIGRIKRRRPIARRTSVVISRYVQ